MMELSHGIQTNQTLFLRKRLMLTLISLPYEVLSNIVANVNFSDVFNLGRTCTELSFLLREESICKSIVQTKIQYSNEALVAMATGGGNSRALRRCAKRRDALSTARPFAVATIGFCDAYLYCKGVLCYTLDDRVRILDLHNSGQNEIVINIPGLLTQALSEIGDHCKGIFQVLYYSDHIISCLYKSSGADSTAWLIAFSLRSRGILVVEELESTDKVFVRHNEQYLYYGTHSELGTDGYKKWVIHGFEFKSRKWFDQKIHLPDMVGSEIGSTICFEFYDGFFYALSNQTSFEVEEIDWTSFYHCIRFPLGSPCKELLEKTENDSKMWRRQHQEGPIDDRWTNLRLDVDEENGKLKIVESRKEWYLGSSRSQRTYYMADIHFPKPPKDEEMDLPANSSSISAFDFDSSSAYAPDGPAFPSASSASANLAANLVTTASTNVSSGSSSNTFPSHDLAALPEGPLKRLLQKTDHPLYIQPPPRLPQNTHPGNDGSKQPTYTLAKSRIRTYHTSCSTFMDLVDDPLPTDWQGKQRLRLRAGSRALGPPLVYSEGDSKGLLRPPNEDLTIALQEMYRESEIAFWPAAQDPDNPDEDLDAVYRLLNPPTHLGNVEGTADERSLIYVTGGCDAPQAIVFVSFDPASKLVGLKRWGGMCRKGVGEGPHVDGRAKGYVDVGERGMNAEKKTFVDVDEGDRTVGIDRKGKGKAKAPPLVQVATGGHAIVDVKEGTDTPSVTGKMRAGPKGWAWKENAMYRDIGLGFYFGL